MNVFQASLVFISFVAAKGNFPAVILEAQYFLAEPKILRISDTEVEVGFNCPKNASYFACPLHPIQRHDDAIAEVLVPHEIEAEKKTIYLNELPLCEWQPQVTFQQLRRTGEFTTYSIGYKVYLTTKNDDHDGTTFDSGNDAHAIRKIFTLTFNTDTKRTISVEYELYGLRFISTASNDKHTFVYEKNEDFLKIDLDHLYQNFVAQILPQMGEEKTKNRLAHASGIQKVQLAPRDDFILDTWKVATYWNINTVPIWRVLLLRWNAIEIYIRKLHKRYFDMRVETGVSGTVEIADRYYRNDTAHKLYIPKYVWKLVTEPYSSKKAMLIVMHNDPFTKYQQPLCMDICTINGWLVSNTDYRTGLVYCCKMDEKIRQALGYSKDAKDYSIFRFTKDHNNEEKLDEISSILSDPQEKLYDW